MSIDLRSIFLSYVLTDFVCFIIVLMLWRQTRKKYHGTGFLVIDFALQVLALLLILGRGVLPDWVSIPFANFSAMLGTVLGLIGLEMLVGKRSNQIHNFIIVIVYTVIHSYFTYIEPNVELRNLNSSITSAILAFQYIWLMWKRVPPFKRKTTFNIGLMFLIYMLLNLTMIFEYYNHENTILNYFNSGGFHIFKMLSSQILFLLFTYFLVLMLNHQLLHDNALQQEKFVKAFRATSSALIISRLSDGKLIEVNRGFTRISEYEANEIIGETTSTLSLWANARDREIMVKLLLKDGCIIENTFKYRRKSGKILTGLVSAEIIELNGEKHVITSITDISEHINNLDRLKTYSKELKDANATKNKLFSIIGHDLRSPFTTITGFSEMIRDEADNLDKETIRNYANILNSSAISTQNLFQNLLEWARVQQGQITFKPETFQIKLLVDEIVGVLSGTAEKKSITINSNLPLALYVSADANMLKTVIHNLVSNALKYSRHGGTVEIGASQTDNETTIFVQDSGIGIDQEIITTLFEPNSKQSLPGTDDEKGTGLGLQLCLEFVKIHGGKIGAESRTAAVPIGSRFTFSLPSTSSGAAFLKQTIDNPSIYET